MADDLLRQSSGQAFNLQRFVDAQAGGVYEQALAELRAGQKRSHWIWFIFPQHRDLGRSPTAKFRKTSRRDEWLYPNGLRHKAAFVGLVFRVPYPSPHIPISRLDQRLERCLIHLRSGFELHMAHALAAAFEKSGRIGQAGAVEEADRGVGGESVDVGEGRFANAGGRHMIVKAFGHV